MCVESYIIGCCSLEIIYRKLLIIQRKLPGNPIFLIAPSGPSLATQHLSRRTKFWHSHLASLGKVVPVTLHSLGKGSSLTFVQCLHHMINTVRTKIHEVRMRDTKPSRHLRFSVGVTGLFPLQLKAQFPGRPLVLLGWNTGALVASQVRKCHCVT